LIAFVIFGSFGMVALLTGVISESMFEKNETRIMEIRHEREVKRDHLKHTLEELFASVENDDAHATVSDLEHCIPEVRDTFKSLDLEYNAHDFDNIVTILDVDGSGSISEEEFVSGILQLMDGVRAVSIQEVFYVVSQIHTKIERMELLQEDVRQITSKEIPELQKEMKELKLKTGGDNSRSCNAIVSNDVDPGVPTQSTETRLDQMRASLASTLDEHKMLTFKKIDDLKSQFKEWRNSEDTERPDNGSPALPDLWSNNLENNAKSTSGYASYSGPRDSGIPQQPTFTSSSSGPRGSGMTNQRSTGSNASMANQRSGMSPATSARTSMARVSFEGEARNDDRRSARSPPPKTAGR